MKTTNTITQAISATEVSENAVPMSIDADSSVFLMDMLGKLYRRPAQAVLREYLSNALDAHASKGGNLPPIQVTLPRKGDKKPLLTIRDFGSGMSEEEFSNILSRYGKSTKRDSNELIGGFGLGAKSGFALSDEFFMSSYQGGQGLRVRIFKDAQNQGYVEVVERFPTAEPDGVLVEVNIPLENAGELHPPALKTFFMAYPRNSIAVLPKKAVGVSIHDSNLFSPLELDGNALGWIGNKRNDTSSHNTIYATIGNVIYSLNSSEVQESAGMEGEKFHSWFEFLWCCDRTKVINVPVGAVDMPSSREEITLSPKTLTTINGVLSNYFSLLPGHFQKEINQLTYREALDYVADLEVSRIPDANFNWRGKPLGKKLMQSSSAYIYVHDGYGGGNAKEGRMVKSFGFATDLRNLLRGALHVFVIPVENDYQVEAVRRKLSQKSLTGALGLLDKKHSVSKSAFIVAPKTDALFEMFAHESMLERPLIDEALRLQAVADAQARIRKQEEARAERVKLASNLTSFILDTSHDDRYLKAYEPEQFFRIARGKVYYWSQEEILRLGFSHDTSPAFPFTSGGLPNSYNILPCPEPHSKWAFEYQHKLLAFLQLFMPKDTRVIILGKGVDLEGFKSAYPKMPSGVQLVSEALGQQLQDAKSDLNYARSVVAVNRDVSTNETKRVALFYGSLSDSQKLRLPEWFRSFAEPLSAAQKWSLLLRHLTETYLNSVLPVFCSDVPHVDAKDSGVEEKVLRKKYPLLFGLPNGAFTNPNIVEDLVAYIQMKDE